MRLTREQLEAMSKCTLSSNCEDCIITRDFDRDSFEICVEFAAKEALKLKEERLHEGIEHMKLVDKNRDLREINKDLVQNLNKNDNKNKKLKEQIEMLNVQIESLGGEVYVKEEVERRLSQGYKILRGDRK